MFAIFSVCAVFWYILLSAIVLIVFHILVRCVPRFKAKADIPQSALFLAKAGISEIRQLFLAANICI
jgi:hypothetical protein